MQVQSLGLENPLEKEMATQFNILAWEIPWAWQATVHAVAKSQTWLSTHALTHYVNIFLHVYVAAIKSFVKGEKKSVSPTSGVISLKSFLRRIFIIISTFLKQNPFIHYQDIVSLLWKYHLTDMSVKSFNPRSLVKVQPQMGSIYAGWQNIPCRIL